MAGRAQGGRFLFRGDLCAGLRAGDSARPVADRGAGRAARRAGGTAGDAGGKLAGGALADPAADAGGAGPYRRSGAGDGRVRLRAADAGRSGAGLPADRTGRGRLAGSDVHPCRSGGACGPDPLRADPAAGAAGLINSLRKVTKVTRPTGAVTQPHAAEMGGFQAKSDTRGVREKRM